MTRFRSLRLLLATALLCQVLGFAADPKGLTVTSSDQIIAHIAEGGQWSTAITLVNLSGVPATFTLGFFADNGTPLKLPFVGASKTSTLSGSIPINGSWSIRTAGLAGPTLQGWAQLESSGQLGGFAVFKSHLAGQADSEAVVPISSRFDARFMLVFDNTNGYVIGTAIVNPSTFTTALVLVTFRDENGVTFHQDSFTMGPHSHLAFSMPQRYPQTANRKGTAEFYTTSTDLSGLGLRFSPSGPFTSFHTLSAVGW